MVDRDVLVVTHPLEPASENHVEALLNILAAITSVSLVTANLRADSTIREKFDVIEISQHGAGSSIPVAASRFILNQLRLCRIIKSRDEEIVLFFGAVSYLVPIAFARLLGRTVILEPRGNVPLTLRLQWEQRIPHTLARGLAGCVWLLERLGYHLSDAIITYTPSMADELGLDRYADKLYPNGARYVDTNRFYPRVDFDDRRNVIGFLGRLDEEKGVRKLTAIAKRLPDDFTFRFIGDGDLYDWIKSELNAEIKDGSVELTGWVNHEEVPRELSNLQLLILPSHPTEGLPTVILESLACGTPVYATPVSGVPDVVREGETGFLLSNTEPNKIAKKIDELFRAEDLSIISKNSQQLIERKYSFEASVERYQQILVDVNSS